MLQNALKRIYKKEFDVDKDIDDGLFKETQRIFELAINKGAKETKGADKEFVQALKDNQKVYSAFRVHSLAEKMAEQLKDEDGKLKSFQEWSNDVKPIASHYNRTWLQTEYNTAVKRTQIATEMKKAADVADVLPNFKWVPSTSAHPGEDHQQFWGTVLPQNHPFWLEHCPGDRWNCKCTIEPTDEDTTQVPYSPDKKDQPAQGLEQNPVKTERIFSDKGPFFEKSCKNCWAKSGAKKGLMGLFNLDDDDKYCNCYDCVYVKNKVTNNKKVNKELYDKYKHDKEYYYVKFNQETGGMTAVHNEHNFDKTGGLFEKQVLNIGYNQGHSIILEAEPGNVHGKRYAEGIFNGLRFEIAGATTATNKNIKKALNHCASKPNVECAVVIFPKAQPSNKVIEEGIRMYSGLIKKGEKGVVEFKKLYFVFKTGEIEEWHLQ